MASFTETISRGVNKVATLESFLSNKRDAIVTQALNGVLIFIILLVFGCLDFAKLTFSFENLLNISFWGEILAKTIGGMCAYNIGINIMWSSSLTKDANLKRAMERYNVLIEHVQLDFEYYCTKIWNPTEKRKAYISQINHRIYRLNKLSRAKDRLLYNSTLPERQVEKEKNLYCIKRKQLEMLKSDEYIKQNLDTIIVKYHEVDPSIFELEIDGESKVTGLKTKGSVRIGRIKATSSMALGMVFFAMFFTAIGLELNKQEFVNQMEEFWYYTLKCTSDFGVIIWQITRGLMQPKRIITSELTIPYTNRNKVLMEYVEWRKTTKQPDSEVYKALQEQVVEIELTDEEIRKLEENKQ